MSVHAYFGGILLKKANHYGIFNCYALGIAKPVVCTSENMADPDYDVIKMVAILNFNKNLLHNILSTGSIFQIGGIEMFRVLNTVYSLLKKKSAK